MKEILQMEMVTKDDAAIVIELNKINRINWEIENMIKI